MSLASSSRRGLPFSVAVLGVLAAQLAFAATVTRGPFLQKGTESGITVVFRTDAPALGRVRYGTAEGALFQQVSGAQATTEHVLTLTGLSASTRYFYSIELDGAVAQAGPSLSFRTYPVKGSPEPFRFLAWGDSGTGSANQYAVAAKMAAVANEPAFGLILGDIIYPAGEAENYDPYFFSPYRELLRRMVIWPTIGNHDVGTLGGQPYLDAFVLPTNNPAGTELYYSWDYGNVHFVSLDTHASSFAPSSAQLQWLVQDLAASNAQWKFVYFHTPPYSGGTHSDSASVKANIVPLLEQAGVDLVFSGHSHVYERTYLLKGGAILQNDKATYDHRISQGSIYVVSGTGGQSGGLSDPNHPLMAFQTGNTLGTSIIDVSGPVVRGYFLDAQGAAVDLFTLYKNTDTEPPGVAKVVARTATQVEVTFTEPVGEGAAVPANYEITPAVAVTGAELLSDARTVRLTTGTHSGGTYKLAVSKVKDTATPTANELPAGTGDFYSLPSTFVPRSGAWRYFVGATDPGAAWTEVSFADSSWSQGDAPLGYGEAGLGTTLTMNDAVTAYARATFTVANPAQQLKLALWVRYDDGFVAYLNGAEVARRGVPAGQDRTTLASASHEAAAFELIDLQAHLPKLVAGKNVLAIEVHNQSATSSDLLLDAELEGGGMKVPAPYLVSFSPENGALGVAADVAVSAELHDDLNDVAAADVSLILNGEEVSPTVAGTPRARTVLFAPPGGFAPGAVVNVALSARNVAGAEMPTVTWSFRVAEAQAPQGDAGLPDAPQAEVDAGAPSGGGGGAVARSCGCSTGASSLPWAAAFVFALALNRRRRRGG